MKTMKRTIALCLLLALFAAALTGCYQIRAAEPDQIYGTYELVTYTHSVTKENTGETAEGESNTETENMIETHGITSYLVVIDSENGYYYYKDNETPAVCYKVSISLLESSDEEEKGKYTYLTFSYGNESVKLGIVAPSGIFSSKTRLNVTHPEWRGNLIAGNVRYAGSTHTVFSRVNKATNLSYLEKQVGKVTITEP